MQHNLAVWALSGTSLHNYTKLNGKGLPQQAKVAQGVPSRIFLIFGTPAFTSGEIPGTHF
jgi:hypothetical protein